MVGSKWRRPEFTQKIVYYSKHVLLQVAHFELYILHSELVATVVGSLEVGSCVGSGVGVDDSTIVVVVVDSVLVVLGGWHAAGTVNESANAGDASTPMPRDAKAFQMEQTWIPLYLFWSARLDKSSYSRLRIIGSP